MAKDAKGNDLQAVEVPVTAALAIAPYDAANVLTSEQGGGRTAQLPDSYVPLGLIKQDGGATESMEQDEAIEFLQSGYQLTADPTMTIQVGLAEFNAAVRKLITGKTPDKNGMISVETYTPDTKWIMFYEEVYKNGRIRRLNGVMQVTTTEIDQTTRGSVKGRNVTMTWSPDPLIGNGSTTKFNEWHWPDDDYTPVTGIAITPATANVEADADVELTIAITPATATDRSFTVESSDTESATVTISPTDPTKAVVHGVKANASPVTITAVSNDSGATATAKVTVNPKA